MHVYLHAGISDNKQTPTGFCRRFYLLRGEGVQTLLWTPRKTTSFSHLPKKLHVRERQKILICTESMRVTLRINIGLYLAILPCMS